MSSPSTDPPADEPTGDRGPDEAFCRNCGRVIGADARYCPDCGAEQRPDPSATAPSSAFDSALEDLFEGGNPFVAAVLSAVFPGLGQIYNRELEKGLLVIVATVVAAFSALIVVGFVLLPAVWLYAIYDAYRVAERQSASRPTTRGADTDTAPRTVERNEDGEFERR